MQPWECRTGWSVRCWRASVKALRGRGWRCMADVARTCCQRFGGAAAAPAVPLRCCTRLRRQTPSQNECSGRREHTGRPKTVHTNSVTLKYLMRTRGNHCMHLSEGEVRWLIGCVSCRAGVRECRCTRRLEVGTCSSGVPCLVHVVATARAQQDIGRCCRGNGGQLKHLLRPSKGVFENFERWRAFC